MKIIRIKIFKIKILVGEEGCCFLFHWLSWKSQQATPEKARWPEQKAFQIQKWINNGNNSPTTPYDFFSGTLGVTGSSAGGS